MMVKNFITLPVISQGGVAYTGEPLKAIHKINAVKQLRNPCTQA